MASNSNRRGMLGKSASVPLDPKYLSNSDEERANRIDTGYPGGVDPANNSPEFKQIPGEHTSKNINEPNLGHRNGDIKFSGFKG